MTPSPLYHPILFTPIRGSLYQPHLVINIETFFETETFESILLKFLFWLTAVTQSVHIESFQLELWSYSIAFWMNFDTAAYSVSDMIVVVVIGVIVIIIIVTIINTVFIVY